MTRKLLIAGLLVGLLGLVMVASVEASILTNTNQSAAYIRMLSRNASLDVDAVYYNPAGLVRLPDGWHFALHNQVIFQDKKINSSFPLLNNPDYVGTIRVPVYPNLYAVYKKNRLALSFGFGPNAGGGSARYKTGLPSFEEPIASVRLNLESWDLPTSGYDVDIFFKGKSVYLGYQFNAAYSVTDWLSVGAGLRFLQARNDYEGHMYDIRYNIIGLGWVYAYDLFMSMGYPEMANGFADKDVKARETGTGWTPILSLNVSPWESLTFSLKYEFRTKMELKTKTTVDDFGYLFPDGLVYRYDVPAILSGGLRYSALPALRFYASFNYFFDRDANWEGAENLVQKNTFELGLGTEYDLNRTVTLSLGYLRTSFNLSEYYQDDLGHELSSDTIGGGARLKISENISLDAGALYVFYRSYTRNFYHNILGTYQRTFDRNTFTFAVGINYKI